MARSKILAASIGVTVIMVIGHFLSFVKEAVIANYFGISSSVDAYTIAIQIPVLLFSFVSVAIQSVVIPIYSDILINKSKGDADKYINNLISLLLLLTSCLVVIGEFAAGGIVYLFSPGFDNSTHCLCVELLRVSLPTLILSIVSQVLVAVLNVHKRFFFPSFAVYFMNIGIIGFVIWLHSSIGILSACVGQLVGDGIRCLFLVILALKLYHFKFGFSWKNDSVNRTLKMSLPVLWSISIAEVNAIVNRIVASFLFVGSIAALTYANKINTVLMQLFVSAIATVVYPLYAESSAKSNIVQLNKRVNLTLSTYALFILPLMAGIFLFKKELIVVAFARGAFDSDAVILTQSILGWYTIGLLFMSFRTTLTNVFYSLKDTRTPAVNATIGVLINMVLNLTLPFIMGVQGLALATSITAVVITSRLMFLLVRQHIELNLKELYSNIPRIVFATVVMSLSVMLFRWLHFIQSSLYLLLIGSVIGILVYLVLCFALRIPIVKTIIGMVHK